MAQQRNPYGLEERVVKHFEDLVIDLEKAIVKVEEYTAKTEACISKQTHEILPLAVQFNQGLSPELDKTVRDSVDDALISLNRVLIDHYTSLSQTVELSNNSKDLVANGYSIIEEHNQNYRNKVAIIVENVTLTLAQKYSTLTAFYVKSMAALKDIWLATKTAPKGTGCCFKVVPDRDPSIWLHYLGYFYVHDLGHYPVGWPDELPAPAELFWKKVLQYIAHNRDMFDLQNIEAEIERANNLLDGFFPICTEQERRSMDQRSALLDEIRTLYQNPFEDAATKEYMERIAREVPCFIKGEEKAPLIYCHEHVKTLVNDIKMYVGSEVGVRACTEHMNEIKRAGFVVTQFECIEKKTLSTDEPVYYLRINTSV